MAKRQMRPGIYPIFNGNPGVLIYVGLTRQAGGLRRRLAQFHRLASTGRQNHAGGVTYHQFFGPDVSDLIFSVHVVADALAASKGLSTYLRDAERFTSDSTSCAMAGRRLVKG